METKVSKQTTVKKKDVALYSEVKPVREEDRTDARLENLGERQSQLFLENSRHQGPVPS